MRSAHIGFAGATGAVLIGIAPLWGLVGFTVAAGIGMGLLGERLSGRDVAIGVVLALALGFGLLFLHYYTAFATQATALLFGNVLAVDRAHDRHPGRARRCHARRARRDHAAADLRELAAGTGRGQGRAAALCLDRFPAIVALAVSECAQIVGMLLVFSLMVGPPATAQRLVTRLVERHGAVRRCSLWPRPGRHRHCLSHRLAGQLLHRYAERVGLFP